MTAPVAKISLFTAITVVVANMVGTGIFGSLGFQVLGLPSGFPILLLWIIAQRSKTTDLSLSGSGTRRVVYGDDGD